MVANAGTGLKTFEDFKQRVNTNPKDVYYSSIGIGSPFHVGMELVEHVLNVDLTHVPYKGSAPAVQAVLSGEVQVSISPIVAVIQHVQGGKLNALAAASADRTSHLPDTPSFPELGLSPVPSWHVLVVPANTPDDIKTKLNEALKAALADEEAVKLMKDIGYKPDARSPEETKAFLTEKTTRWQQVIKDRNITLD